MRRLSMMRYVLALLILCINLPAHSLTFSSPPRESKAVGDELYQPLAQYLSMVLGEEVSYEHPTNWLHYQRSIKRDEFDIVFDGPHLASWRIKHHGHTPIMMLPGNLVFYFITRNENTNVNQLLDLAVKKVCVLPPPNLNALILLEILDGPAREPVVKGIKGGLKNVIKSLMADECEGAVVPAGFYNKKLPEKQQNQLRIIHQSAPLPNQVITVSKRLSSQQVQQIRKAFSTDEGLRIINKFGKRFGGDFIPAEAKAYDGPSRLLENSILGWQGKSDSTVED